jgi:hypothetical protein
VWHIVTNSACYVCIVDSDNNFKRCRTYISPRPYIDKRELIAAVRLCTPH